MAGTAKKQPAKRKSAPKKATEPQSVVNIRDERAQEVFDIQQLDNTLRELRQLMAAAKVNRRLAQQGLLSQDQDLHPRKFDLAIGRHRQAIELLKSAYGDLTGNGLPEGGQLEPLSEDDILAASGRPNLG